MWVFLREGFVSVVCARKGDGAPDRPIDKKRLMVRARARDHLDTLQRRYPRLRRYEIIETPRRDYRFRIIVPKQVWRDVMTALVEATDYDNHKNAVEERGETGEEYRRCLHAVWAETLRLQRADVSDWGDDT